jgi:hypothetical protein
MKRAIASLGLLLVCTVATSADEIDKLVEEVKPPARFKDYQPKFSIKAVELRGCDQTKRLFGGRLLKARPDLPTVVTIITKTHMLLDGDRYVGMLRDGCFTWFTGSPAENVNELIHLDNWIYQRSFDIDFPLGPTLKHWTQAWDEGTSKVRIEAGKVYIDTPSPDARIENGTVSFAWTERAAPGAPTTSVTQPHKDPAAAAPPSAKAEHRAVVRVDPVLGYVVEHEVKYESNFVRLEARGGEPSFSVDYGSFFPHGNTNPWPKYQSRYSYAWQFYTPAPQGDVASGNRFGVWRANGVSIDNVRRTKHCFVQGNGLVGYLKNPAGWGLALTKSENPQHHSTAVCPAYGEFYMSGPLPKQPDKDGFYRLHVKRRCTGIPPEICDFILKSAPVRFDGQKALQIRLTGEDFEDQPLPFTTQANGIAYRWPSHPAQLSDQVAHTGRRSLQVKGVPWETITTSFPQKEAPPARFDPNTRYRLECWIKVEGAGTEAFVSIHMIGQTRDASAINRWRSESVTAGDWRKVSYQVTMPPDGLAVILGFVCAGGGTAWFDDFKLEEIGPAVR